MKINQLKNSNGMGLIEVLIASTIAITVIYVISSAVLDMMAQQRRVALKSEWNQFVDNIHTTLNEIQSCTNSLNGVPFDLDLDAANGTPVTLKNIRLNGPTPVNLSAPFDINTGLRLTQLVMHAANNDVFLVKKEFPIGSGILVDHEIRKASFTLRGDMTIRSSVTQIKPATLTYSVLVRAGNIVECRGQDQDALLRLACEQLGGSYDNTLPPDQRCKPAKFCKSGGGYQVGGSNNPFTGGQSCPGPAQGFESGYTAFKSGEFTVYKSYACGKSVCTTSTLVQSYQCMLCN